MKVLIAMNAFKGNLTSLEAAKIVENGLRRVYPDALVNKIPVADGGDGTVNTLVSYLKGKYVQAEVKGPLHDKVVATYGIIDKTTAVIEMAQASGLSLLNHNQYNPLLTSTFGTGQLIIDALNHGCRKIIIGIGGSATNDGGQGMAAALGARFLDKNGKAVGLGGQVLNQIADIDLTGLDKRLGKTEFLAACDVDNPLTGKQGASRIFGPQKGATPEMIEDLDKGLINFANVIKSKIGIDILNIPGSGAAGGLGGGLLAFCQAKLKPGVEIIMDTVDIDSAIRQADIVVTGEGRLDSQSAHGKVPSGVARRAKKYGKPVFAITGYAGESYREVYKCGIDGVFSSIVAPMDNAEAMKNSVELISNASENLFRTIKAVNCLS